MIEDKIDSGSEIEEQAESGIVNSSQETTENDVGLKNLLRMYSKDTRIGVFCCIILAGLCAIITNLCSCDSVPGLLSMMGITFGIFEAPVVVLLLLGLQSEFKLQSSVLTICTVYSGISLWSLLHRAFLGVCPWSLISVLIVAAVLDCMIAIGKYRRDSVDYTPLGSKVIVGILSVFIAGFGVFFCMSSLVLGVLGDNLEIGSTLFFGLQGFIINMAINSHSIDCLKSMFDNWMTFGASVAVAIGLIVCCFACGLSSSQLVFICVIEVITIPVVMVTQGIVKLIERIPKHD